MHAISKTVAAYDMGYNENKDFSGEEWKTEDFEYVCIDVYYKEK